MIRAILFDFDGVLTLDKTGSQSILKYLAQKTNIPMDKLKREYYVYNHGLLCGEITHKDMWAAFCKGVDFDIDYSLLIESFQNTPLDDEMLSFVKELHKKYYVGLITENKSDRIDEILRFYHLSEMFVSGISF